MTTFSELERIARERIGRNDLADPCVLSDFVFQQTQRHPHYLVPPSSLSQVMSGWADLTHREALMEKLRCDRNWRMVHWIRRQMHSRAETFAIASELSEYARELILWLLDWIEGHLSESFGRPMHPDGRPAPLVVLMMGKLGGAELNLSSDIDLIFSYPDDVQLSGGKRTIDVSTYYTRVAQQLVQMLSELTPEGFVFRVDTRLRPFGQSGPLVCSFDAMEQYYQQHARGWERFALLRMAALSANAQDAEQLQSMLMKFVYRRYIDFSVLETPRDIKRRIEAEQRQRHLADDIKLGVGGIRELEFIVQSMQLIHGGKHNAVRERNTIAALSALASTGLMPEAQSRQLQKNYEYLRFIEHALQGFTDQQTHQLPKDPLNQQRLCVLTGADNWPEFLARLSPVRQQVHEQFKQIFSTEDIGEDTDNETAFWSQSVEALTEALAQCGFRDPMTAAQAISRFRDDVDRPGSRVGQRGRKRLFRLVPQLTQAVAKTPTPDRVLQDWLTLLHAIRHRTAYLDLFCENPMTVTRLTDMMSASHWVASHAARYPLVLDELLNPAFLNDIPTVEDIEDDLRRRLLGVPDSDEETLWEVLREHKQQWIFHLGVAFATGHLPIGQLQKLLTGLANGILTAVTRFSIRRQFPAPDDKTALEQFVLLGYGKLGSGELSLGSDLDLVFLHQATDDDRIAGYLRVVRRIVQMLSTQTFGGILYHVDTRLRPSGRAGLLISSFDSYARYQREEAWTWEHQALVKARVVVGPDAVRTRFENLRREILSKRRNPHALLEEVREMRARIQQQTKLADWQETIKIGDGGLIDIEFLVQYLVLCHAHAAPALVEPRDTAGLLNALAQYGFLDEETSTMLANVHRNLLDALNQCEVGRQPDSQVIETSMTEADRVIRALGL